MVNDAKRSRVIIAGAGPGDAELITVKALQYLQKADVVIIDRLVDQSLLNHTKLGAKIFFVGKEGGSPGSFTQENINELLVSEAKPGKLILRLKGGDVSFFSNVFSELEILSEKNIPFEIVPGVTAASGAAAYAGIPLTARGIANTVRFLAVPHTEVIDEVQLREWSSSDDTLVFYMSSRSLAQLISRLIESEIESDKWVAVIEQATTPYQKVTAHPIKEFLSLVTERKFISPSLVIIGRVAKLHQRFNWKQKAAAEMGFFPGAGFLREAKVA